MCCGLVVAPSPNPSHKVEDAEQGNPRVVERKDPIEASSIECFVIVRFAAGPEKNTPNQETRQDEEKIQGQGSHFQKIGNPEDYWQFVGRSEQVMDNRHSKSRKASQAIEHGVTRPTLRRLGCRNLWAIGTLRRVRWLNCAHYTSCLRRNPVESRLPRMGATKMWVNGSKVPVGTMAVLEWGVGRESSANRLKDDRVPVASKQQLPKPMDLFCFDLRFPNTLTNGAK